MSMEHPLKPLKVFVSLLALTLLVSCASGKVTGSKSYSENERIPPPDQIIVYDFAVTTGDLNNTEIAANSANIENSRTNSEEIARERKLASQIAIEVTKSISKMGLHAIRASENQNANVGDILIKGQFLTVDEGDKAGRILVGFGFGAGELVTRVEGFLVEPDGIRRLGHKDITAKGGFKPGALVPAMVTVATHNPLGLIVSSALSVKGEIKEGSETLEGAAQRIAEVISDELEKVFKEQAWIN